jgi:polar amino acid transport system substrate-binding protein
MRFPLARCRQMALACLRLLDEAGMSTGQHSAVALVSHAEASAVARLDGDGPMDSSRPVTDRSPGPDDLDRCGTGWPWRFNLGPAGVVLTGGLVSVALLLAGCAYPADPDGTLDRVSGGVMRVGITESDPWTQLPDAGPSGVEVRLVEDFASTLDADVMWVEGSEGELIGALHEDELDLVIGGLTKDLPWDTEVAITRPYAETRLLVGAPDAEAVPEDLAGARVAVEAGHEAGALLEQKTDAIVTRVDDLRGTDLPVAAHDWELEQLRLEPTQVELTSDQHVMATRMGENAWQVALERYLADRREEVHELLLDASL